MKGFHFISGVDLFLTCIERISNYPTVAVFEKKNRCKDVINFLEPCLNKHCDPRNVRLDQAACLVGKKRRFP